MTTDYFYLLTYNLWNPAGKDRESSLTRINPNSITDNRCKFLFDTIGDYHEDDFANPDAFEIEDWVLWRRYEIWNGLPNHPSIVQGMTEDEIPGSHVMTIRVPVGKLSMDVNFPLNLFKEGTGVQLKIEDPNKLSDFFMTEDENRDIFGAHYSQFEEIYNDMANRIKASLFEYETFANSRNGIDESGESGEERTGEREWNPGLHEIRMDIENFHIIEGEFQWSRTMDKVFQWLEFNEGRSRWEIRQREPAQDVIDQINDVMVVDRAYKRRLDEESDRIREQLDELMAQNDLEFDASGKVRRDFADVINEHNRLEDVSKGIPEPDNDDSPDSNKPDSE